MKQIFRPIIVAVASLPVAYVGFFTVGWFCTLVGNFFVEGPPFGFFFHHSVIILNLLLIALLTAGCLIVATMAHILVTNRLDAEAKGIWLFLLLLANIVSLPLYWYLDFMDAAQQIVGPERR